MNIKKANCIVIGGPIAVGKSSLVGQLPFKQVQELDANDELQAILLEKMYEGDEIATHVFQLDIMLLRFDKYKNLANDENMHVFDRSIFEDYIFAKLAFGHKTNIWNYYESIWKDKVDEMINEIGLPKLYICLSFSWGKFKERLFKRNRHSETDNFDKNEKYFRALLEQYDTTLKSILNRYEVDAIFINTDNLNALQVNDIVVNELRKRGINNEK